MPMQLSDTMNFMHQVASRFSFDGQVALSRFDRLADVLLDQAGQVSVGLEFGMSIGYASLKGQIVADLQLECQRCMQPMPLAINNRFKFAFIHDETEIDSIPGLFEPYLITGDEQSIINLLEDEILLVLPMVARHEQACSDYMTKQRERVRAEKQASHPFSALKALKVAKE